jgi:transposase InsO family protein
MPALTVEDQCRLAEVSRAGFYRHWREKAPHEEDLQLRDRLQRWVAETRQRRGYRPLTAQLRREGQRVNHKRVLRLMREDNLLCLRSKKFVLTTDSRHNLRVYTNLARGLKLAGLNQLWVADITFIRLRSEFIYLAVILDAHSRRVIGWALERTLKTELPLAALQQALRERDWKPGQLVHHSDRGVQYASDAYTELLEENGVAISMSRAGNPYDNARAERFMRTLKHEEVNASQYHDLEDARSRIGEFLGQVYNQRRLHSALGYQPPAEFEQRLLAAEPHSNNPAPEKEAVETAGADGNRGKPPSRFPPVSHSSLEIPAGFPQFPQPATTSS